MRRIDHRARAPYGPKSTVRNIPPKATRHGPARRAPGQRRDWAAVDRRLKARGDLRLLVDREWLAALAGDGRDRGRGRPYDQTLVELAVMLAAAAGTGLRQAEGITRMILDLLGATGVATPDHSTLCRRRRRILFRRPGRPGPITLAVDASGITLATPGEWTRNKYNDKRKARFVKLHAGIDTLTGKVHAIVVTDAAGEGTGDVTVGACLIEQAARTGKIDAVLADRAYDAKTVYDAARAAGGRLITPLKDNAARGLHPDRDTHLDQIGRIGPPEWRRRVGYGDRAHVEGFFSALKRTTGHRSNARSLAGATAEIVTRINLYNHWIGEKTA